MLYDIKLHHVCAYIYLLNLRLMIIGIGGAYKIFYLNHCLFERKYFFNLVTKFYYSL